MENNMTTSQDQKNLSEEINLYKNLNNLHKRIAHGSLEYLRKNDNTI